MPARLTLLRQDRQRSSWLRDHDRHAAVPRVCSAKVPRRTRTGALPCTRSALQCCAARTVTGRSRSWHSHP